MREKNDSETARRGGRAPLLPRFGDGTEVEAGVDEAGRGCLAGPVVAAAVVWNPEVDDELSRRVRDSKKLSRGAREELAAYIRATAVDHAVCFVDNQRIDAVNILNATVAAMHGALDALTVDVDHIIVDGDRFRPYLRPRPEGGDFVPHACVVGGDDKYLAVAAASILAKVARDEFMRAADGADVYGWSRNAGYGTREHMQAIRVHGPGPLHRHTFLKKMMAAAMAPEDGGQQQQL